jgi:hypothetical protein
MKKLFVAFLAVLLMTGTAYAILHSRVTTTGGDDMRDNATLDNGTAYNGVADNASVLFHARGAKSVVFIVTRVYDNATSCAISFKASTISGGGKVFGNYVEDNATTHVLYNIAPKLPSASGSYLYPLQLPYDVRDIIVTFTFVGGKSTDTVNVEMGRGE